MWAQLILWIVIAAFALAVDAATSSFLFIWFTVGGILAVILTLLHFPFSTQLITFIASSVTLMAIGYPIVKKTIKKTVPITPRMEEEYIGQEFICDKNIKEKATIKFGGIYWTVKNVGEYIDKGEKVKIIGIEGNKLVIKKN
ncbi:NfeD family protein [Clostridium ganghwense]|uniref:NfeD family protein n=1 Tax=Clostridium ganghwense TaxID=312089 RepID=A0ABT4CS52_9CLOT|nr:NfeD family protein [Clostridium ganghwense]MCY6371897.1 NfeD family protein [Clostridium ganghwense]